MPPLLKVPLFSIELAIGIITVVMYGPLAILGAVYGAVLLPAAIFGGEIELVSVFLLGLGGILGMIGLILSCWRIHFSTLNGSGLWLLLLAGMTASLSMLIPLSFEEEMKPKQALLVLPNLLAIRCLVTFFKRRHLTCS